MSAPEVEQTAIEDAEKFYDEAAERGKIIARLVLGAAGFPDFDVDQDRWITVGIGIGISAAVDVMHGVSRAETATDTVDALAEMASETAE